MSLLDGWTWNGMVALTINDWLAISATAAALVLVVVMIVRKGRRS